MITIAFLTGVWTGAGVMGAGICLLFLIGHIAECPPCEMRKQAQRHRGGYQPVGDGKPLGKPPKVRPEDIVSPPPVARDWKDESMHVNETIGYKIRHTEVKHPDLDPCLPRPPRPPWKKPEISGPDGAKAESSELIKPKPYFPVQW